jgi:site-specific DNA recombinase
MPLKDTPSSRVHIYNRVSSPGQADNSSLDAQEADCRQWCAEHGLTVASVAREVWSGADRRRPQFDALLDRLAPGDVVLAYNLDRFSRAGQVETAVALAQIHDAGATLQLVTEPFEQTETGMLFFNMRAWKAATERADIRRRTQRGRRDRAASGKPIPGSKPPYGYAWADARDKDGKLLRERLDLNPETAPIVRDIFDLALSGTSLRAIAAALDARGIATPYGADRWSAGTVRRILLRETYATGDATAYAVRFEPRPKGAAAQPATKRPRYSQRPGTDDERITIAGIAPPIVTRDEQAAVAARLAANQQFATRNNAKPETALLRAGFARCGHCGWAMRVNNGSDGRARYCCSRYRTGECARPVIMTHILDDAVWGGLRDVLRDPAIIEREVEKHRHDGGLDRDLAAIDKLLVTIAKKQTRTAKAIAAVDDDAAAAPLILELKSLAEQKAEAQAEHEAVHARIADAEAERARVRSLTDWCRTVGANLDTLTYEEKRLALTALGVSVKVWREGATDADGTPLGRYAITMKPAPVAGNAPIVSHGTCSTRARHRHHGR